MSTPRAGRAVSVTTKVQFDGFADLPTQRDAVGEYCVESEEFTCLGIEWRLRISPCDTRTDGLIMVSAFLRNSSKKNIHIDYSFSVKGYASGEVYTSLFKPANVVNDDSEIWGEDIGMRSNIIQTLVDGALVIEVCMKLADKTQKTHSPFIPENPSCKIIQGMFMDETYSDIFFELGGQQFNSKERKKTKTSTVIFPAHQFILTKCSSTLAKLCESAGDKTAPIPIPDVSPDVFRHLLYHLYGGKVADDDMKTHAKEIVDAADRWEVVDLKLEAEACLVQTTAFGVENLLDLLLFAESKNCALLKEAAMDFILETKDEVLEKVSFDDAPGALVRDVLAALRRGEKRRGTVGDNGTDLSAMSISKLRWKAHRNGLNVDGSREMLIAALERGNEDVVDR